MYQRVALYGSVTLKLGMANARQLRRQQIHPPLITSRRT